MNIKTENLEIEEWKPDLQNLHNIEYTPSFLEEIVKCEIKQEYEDTVKIEANKHLEKDPLDIEKLQFETQNLYENKDEIKKEFEEKFNQNNTSVHKGLKNHKCDLCDKAFSMKNSLMIHIKIVHEGVKNHKCDQCGKAFSQSGLLKRHINNVHEGLKSYKCDLCDQNFTQHENLKTHISSVHEGQKKSQM